MMEKIIYASIKRTDNCIIYGKHHGECIQKSPYGTCKAGSKQGFLTDTFRFVDRKEALIIASRANQLIDPIKEGDILISEMLWDANSGGFHDYSPEFGYLTNDYTRRKLLGEENE